MIVELSSPTQKLLENLMSTGLYRTTDDALRAALETLDRLNRFGLDEATLNAIDCAEDQLHRGEVRDWKQARQKVRDSFLGA